MSTRMFITIGLAACTACSGGDITEPETPQLPPPPSSYVYSVVITLDSIRVSSVEACDGKDLFGNPIPGAFHYRVAGKANMNQDLLASSGYGDVFGAATSRGPRGVIRLNARRFTFAGLDAVDAVKLEFSMIEWDGPLMDRVLNGQVVIVSETPGKRGLDFRNPDDVAVGDPSTCGGTLYYQLQVTGKEK